MKDKYTSMDELKADVEALKPYLPSEDYDLILYACGLLANQGICEEVELQGRLVHCFANSQTHLETILTSIFPVKCFCS